VERVLHDRPSAEAERRALRLPGLRERRRREDDAAERDARRDTDARRAPAPSLRIVRFLNVADHSATFHL
jgi:hypothetical protein